MDTIFALASARGKSGVAVVRISGSGAQKALGEFCSPVDSRGLRKLIFNGSLLDEALVLNFPAPNSFTGENVVELHLHGSPAIVNVVLTCLSGMEGLRLAEAGEFTRRALENERLDLAQVEGLSDLIEAETEAQRRQAVSVFSGALGEKADRWRTKLVRAAALIEATIDFADEDVPIDVTPEVNALLQVVSAELVQEATGFGAAERIRDGFEVAIVGPPNVGKSTLLNALAGRKAALTSSVAGTTRDVIEVRMDLKGLPVTFLDTAGLRDASDDIERLGVELARERAEKADVRLILLEAAGAKPVLTPHQGDVVAVSKRDLHDGDFSAMTGAGLDSLVDKIASELETRASLAGVAIRDRHRISMERAVTSLGIAQDQLRTSPELAELSAEELRSAIRALDALVGRVDVENLLDEIFSSFCIGK
ncbi:MAG: tRNA uridine-5-carboxymethylaminomethyl(34) synthesis GTPase MnmE [Silicimonas sp.]|nr:tRNA uridine-5-carboxymethylaminomethyl(34) synthesis GTPase MnmE [Silicimonas sp.]